MFYNDHVLVQATVFLFVSYDLLVGTPGKLYWVLTSVAYLLGLVATFISLFLMNAAQPVSFLFLLSRSSQ